MRRAEHIPWVHSTSECEPAVPSGHRGVVAALAVRVRCRVSLSSPHAGVGGRDPAGGGDSGLSEPESQQPPLPPFSIHKKRHRACQSGTSCPQHGPAGTGQAPPTAPPHCLPTLGSPNSSRHGDTGTGHRLGFVALAGLNPTALQGISVGKGVKIWDRQEREKKPSGYLAPA